MAKEISIGDEVWVHGYVDEIRKDCIIIRNDGGYFGTVAEKIGYCDDYEVLADTPQTEAPKKWETPPKFEPPTVNTTCVSVIGVRPEEVPKQTDCPEYHNEIECGSCNHPQTDCPWK